MNRFENVDTIRCLANYLIILLHASASLQYADAAVVDSIFWQSIFTICNVALPAFFLISGYLLFVNYDYKKYPFKIKNRLKRLFVPYISWNILFVIFYLSLAAIVPRLSSRVAAFELNSFFGALSKIISINTPPIDGPLWFIRTLLFLAFISPLFFWLSKSKLKIAIGGGILFLAYIVCYSSGFICKIVMSYPLYAFVLFFVGAILAQIKKSNIDTIFHSHIWAFIGIIGIVLLFYSKTRGYIFEDKYAALTDDIAKLICTPLLFYLVDRSNAKSLLNCKWFQKASKLSFFAYAGHFLFCSMILHTVMPHIGYMGVGKCTIGVILFFGCGTLLMSVVYILGQKYFPRTTKFFDGTL